MAVEVQKRLSAEERRERILSGAMQTFAELGYHDASMAGIARAAGITPAVIYDHFASKQELHSLLLETQTDLLIAHVGRSVVDVGDDPGNRMRAGIDAFFEFVEAHPFAWRLMFRDPPGDARVGEVYAALSQRATTAIAILIDMSAPKALADYPHREQALEMFGEMLKTSLNGLAAWWYEHRDVPRSEIVDRVMDFCWIGLDRLAESGR